EERVEVRAGEGDDDALRAAARLVDEAPALPGVEQVDDIERPRALAGEREPMERALEVGGAPLGRRGEDGRLVAARAEAARPALGGRRVAGERGPRRRRRDDDPHRGGTISTSSAVTSVPSWTLIVSGNLRERHVFTVVPALCVSRIVHGNSTPETVSVSVAL